MFVEDVCEDVGRNVWDVVDPPALPSSGAETLEDDYS
jgi:hypothetical protein